jgi:hypothetical protein
MATHYTCDNCGEEIPAGFEYWRHGGVISFVVDGWKSGDGVKELVVTVKIAGGAYDESDADAPDLCATCRAHVLRQAAFVIDPERQLDQQPRGLLQSGGLPQHT